MNPMTTLMDEIIGVHIRKKTYKAVSKDWKKANAFHIDKVAPWSPAQFLGIERGDWLIDINSRPAASYDLWDWMQQSSSHSYEIFQPQHNRVLCLHTTGMPLGFDCSKSNEAILVQYQKHRGNYEDLTDLWRRFEWDTLNSIRQLKLRDQGWFEKKVNKLRKREVDPNQIEWLFQGVSVYENGFPEEGMEVINGFAEACAHNWQMVYSSIGMYYRAMEALRGGDLEEALEGFRSAWEYFPTDPAAHQIRKLGGLVPDSESYWNGRSFPVAYHLPQLEHSSLVSLGDALGRLQGDAVHCVALLANSRANQPYERFLQRFQVFAQYFPNLFRSLHVITAATEDNFWQYREDEVRAAGIDFNLLHDQENRLANATSLQSTPGVFFLDGNGRIIRHDVLYTQVDFWDFMALLLNDNTEDRKSENAPELSA